jgi:hypothetical protein
MSQSEQVEISYENGLNLFGDDTGAFLSRVLFDSLPAICGDETVLEGIRQELQELAPFQNSGDDLGADDVRLNDSADDEDDEEDEDDEDDNSSVEDQNRDESMNNNEDCNEEVAEEEQGIPSNVIHCTGQPPLAEIYGESNAAGISPASHNSYRAIMKHWRSFIKAKGDREALYSGTGLSLYTTACEVPYTRGEAKRFFEAGGTAMKIDNNLVNQFLNHQAAKPEMTKQQFKKTGGFLRMHAQAEYRHLFSVASSIKEGAAVNGIPSYVRNVTAKDVSPYNMLMKTVKSRKADLDRDNGVDIQADKPRPVTLSERWEMVKEAFLPTIDETKKRHPLYLLQQNSQAQKANQVLMRGEGLRDVALANLFAEPCNGLGPRGEMICGGLVVNRGECSNF